MGTPPGVTHRASPLSRRSASGSLARCGPTASTGPVLPREPWGMRMTWHDLLFTHWAFPPDVLSPLVPGMLSL